MSLMEVCLWSKATGEAVGNKALPLRVILPTCQQAAKHCEEFPKWTWDIAEKDFYVCGCTRKHNELLTQTTATKAGGEARIY